jgi:hypothetical protein
MNSVRTVGPPFLFPSSQWMIRLPGANAKIHRLRLIDSKFRPRPGSSGLASSTP